MDRWSSLHQQYVTPTSRRLWKQRIFSDLEVHIGEAVFFCHRYVLACSSQLFLSELTGRPTGSNFVAVTEPQAQDLLASETLCSFPVHGTYSSSPRKDCVSISSRDGGADGVDLDAEDRPAEHFATDLSETRTQTLLPNVRDARGSKASSRTVVRLSNIRADTFAVILNALYAGHDPVTKVNAVELFAAASLLDISSLVQHCEISIANLVRRKELPPSVVLLDPAMSSRPALVQSALDMMAVEFAVAPSSSDWFVQLPGGALLTLVDDERLNAPHEDDVYQALCRWYQHDPQKRLQFLEQAFCKLRLANLDKGTLLNKVLTYCHSLASDAGRREDCVTSTEGLFVLVQRALAYHLLPDRRHDEVMRITDFRQSQSLERILLVMGDQADKLFAFSFRRQAWYLLASPPQPFGLGVAACCYFDDLYCSGGEKTPSAFFRYRPKTDTWQKLPDLHEARRNHACAAVGDAIFVLGGKNDRLSNNKDTLTSVERFLLKDRSKGWTLLSTTALPVPVRSMATAVVDRRIYLIGGRTTGLAVSVATVQYFDTVTLECCLLTNLPFQSCLARTVVCNRLVYVLESNGDFFRFHPDDCFAAAGGKVNGDSISRETLHGDWSTGDHETSLKYAVQGGNCVREVSVVTKVGRVRHLNWAWYGAALHYDGTLYVVAGELPRGVSDPMVAAESADENVFRKARFIRPAQMNTCHVTSHMCIPRDRLLQKIP